VIFGQRTIDEGERMTERPDPHTTAHAKRFRSATQQKDDSSESLFLRAADWVSEAMGKPANIIFWLVLVLLWTIIFAAKLVPASGSFLPGWFVGQGYNFPLNLLTTVAELFIGFLVAAASNRSQRALTTIIDGIRTVLDHTEHSVETQTALIEANTALTEQVHELAQQIHAHITGEAALK
jgi:low affinity Fe/Cu permease